MSQKKRITVLGGGPAGYPAAFLAADHGMEVTLIDEKNAPGGVCLFKGCIPSKTLLHVAKLIHESRDAVDWGIDFGKPKIDLEKLQEHGNSVIRKMTGGLDGLAKQRKIRFIQGRGVIDGPTRVRVQDLDGNDLETIESDFIVVATGSSPRRISEFPDSPHIMSSTDALRLDEIPENMLVVGGGYIGLELGLVYSALGSQISVVEALPRLLNAADPDLVEQLQSRLNHYFEEITLSTRVKEIVEENGRLRVKFLGLDRDDDEGKLFDKVLVAIGRRPKSANIGLETTSVEIQENGWIVVDEQRRTAEPTIFAIGDVVGEPMLAHKATHEARVAIDAIAGEASEYNPAAIPAVVFTDPEIAWCGLTEQEARTKGIPHVVSRFPWSASGRATTLGRNDGPTKLILDPNTERVLGVGICGVGAGELIAEGVLAIEMGAIASDIQMSIHAHPTTSETMMEAADLYYGLSPHYMKRER